MLGAGIFFLGLGIFFFWVMMNGDSFITAGDWKDAVNQVGDAFKGWLGGNPPAASGNGASPTPNSNNSAPSAPFNPADPFGILPWVIRNS